MFRSSAFVFAGLLTIGASAAEVETFTIHTLAAQMRYDLAEMAVQPGAQVKIIFENLDDLPHNLVFFQPGTDVVAMSNKQMEKPEEALKRNWLPDDDRMWAHSKMLNPKEKEEVTFRAPEKPGIYPYVCSFPGHAQTMQGKLKVFPAGPTLGELKFQTYLGKWAKLPDFASLQPHRQGEVTSNKIELKFDDYKNEFGVVFNGTLEAPSAGEYLFSLACDDGARILLDGKKVVEYDGVHPSNDIREGKVKLAAGIHKFRLEYFQAAGEAEIYAAWQGPDFATTPLSKWIHPKWKAGAASKKNDETTGMPLVVGQEPLIYRNFITGAGNRGIGVGYPGGMNVAWNAESMNLALIWRGAFIDAARHWNSRGGGAQAPLGYNVFKPAGEAALPFAILTKPETEWPVIGKGERAAGYQWKGYHLDAQRFPTFNYQWKGIEVTDSFRVEGDGPAGTGKLIRTLVLKGALPADARFRAATGTSIQAAGSAYLIDNGFNVAVEGATIVGKDLIVPVRPKIELTYSWPANQKP